jgi:transcriptional regulator GlxA family with amidase domain
MLSSGQFKIKEVAANCGFDDYYYFSKVFKNIKGYPPSKVVLHIYGL